MPQCANCESDRTASELKNCARCRSIRYCSRECQKADWKKHKKTCASSAASNSSASTNPPKGLQAPIDKPFHRLDDQTYLHNRPESDVYKLLIDTYRFRMEDNYAFEGDVDADGIYGGAPDGRPGFRRFLRLASSRTGLLPPWWSTEKAAACERFGQDRADDWSSLACAIEKSDVMEHYGSQSMPMQLRMLGEQVYGRGPGGQSGAMMRQLQMRAESGGIHSTSLSLS